jgi:hypothetical protein
MAATLMSMNYFPPSPAATDANSMVKKEQLLSTAFQMREQVRNMLLLWCVGVGKISAKGHLSLLWWRSGAAVVVFARKPKPKAQS